MKIQEVRDDGGGASIEKLPYISQYQNHYEGSAPLTIESIKSSCNLVYIYHPTTPFSSIGQNQQSASKLQDVVVPVADFFK